MSNYATHPSVPLFTSIGLNEAKAQEVVKSPKNAAALKDIIENNATLFQNRLEEKRAGLVMTLALALAKSGDVDRLERDYVTSKVVNGQLKTVEQVNGERGLRFR